MEIDFFSDIANKAAPQKNVRLRNFSHVWLSKDMKNLMIKRDYVHNKFLNLKKRLTYDNIEQETSVCNELWNEYKMLRNKVNISMKDCKATYYKTAIEKYSDNAGKMWKCLSSLLPSKKIIYITIFQSITNYALIILLLLTHLIFISLTLL